MKNATSFDLILQHQKAWASEKGTEFEKAGRSDAYVYSLADNLFNGRLLDRTLAEYEAGQGGELKSHMKALYSSSALVVNVFEYWRRTGRIAEIATACGASVGITEMEFEKKHKIANLGTPNLDIEFSGRHTTTCAVEAKFTEPYRTTTQRNGTHLGKYLNQARLWGGLDRSRNLAQGILEQEGKKTGWKHLDTPQLIKHLLGLKYCYQQNEFTLLYLWFDCDTVEAKEHHQEIDRFREFLDGEVDFRTMTYQELLERIKSLSGVDGRYLDYLERRYFTTI